MGNVGAPPNGVLMLMTDWNTSGRMRAHHSAVGPPQSCPTTHATLWCPIARTSPKTSVTRLITMYGTRESENDTGRRALSP